MWASSVKESSFTEQAILIVDGPPNAQVRRDLGFWSAESYDSGLQASVFEVFVLVLEDCYAAVLTVTMRHCAVELSAVVDDGSWQDFAFHMVAGGSYPSSPPVFNCRDRRKEQLRVCRCSSSGPQSAHANQNNPCMHPGRFPRSG
jgi:hypothetical protein